MEQSEMQSMQMSLRKYDRNARDRYGRIFAN